MSEFINNTEKRLSSLLQFSLGIMSGQNGKELYEEHKAAIDCMTPYDMINLEDQQLKMGITVEEIKKFIDKVINVFYTSLSSYEWTKPEDGSFLYYLMFENKMLEFKLNKAKKILKTYNKRDDFEKKRIKEDLIPHFEDFLNFDAHYVKKENILFPYLENVWTNHRPLKVMWSLHDDIRKKLKLINNLLKSDESTWKELAREIGSFYFLVFGMIQKENLVVFPIAFETLQDDLWSHMHLQSFDYPFPFIEVPEKPEIVKSNEPTSVSPLKEINGDLLFHSETGNLNVEQIELILNILPLDMTLVDENDKVVYFSNPQERFFSRSPAIIGRDVQNCHPPESVHIVEKIVKAFKKNEKRKAKFWIQMNGKFIVIQYFALRNNEGQYKGVLEMSQEITDLRNLQGEKRLLDWE